MILIQRQLANFVTCASLSLGMIAILIAINTPHISLSALLVMLSAILDRYDGKIARKFNQVSSIGQQLDSFNDIISFGVAPILLISQLDIFVCSSTSYAIFISYVLAGVIRLSRFNLDGDTLHFKGLPITFSAFVLIWIVLLHNHAFTFSTTFLLSIIFVLSVFMVSTFKFRKF